VQATTLHGQPLQDGQDYRVSISSFLATGGSDYSVLAQGRDAQGGMLDVDVLEGYLRSQSPVPAPPTDRITRLSASTPRTKPEAVGH
ncbi:MAG: hypothetical protein PHU77_00885, partial [Simplicispira sp.]|nr:hypothetical protein [Simplicispira sp.]